MNPLKKATRWTRLAAILAALAVLYPVTLTAQEATAAEGHAQQLAKADELLAKREFSSAIQAYRRVNELTGGTSVAALLGIAIACYHEQRYSESLEAAREMLELTDEEGMQKAANNLLGISILGLPDRKTADLEEAERAFRKVIELSEGDDEAPRWSLAIVLHELGRENEALGTLNDLVSSDPPGPFADRARDLAREIQSEFEREVSESAIRQAGGLGEEGTQPVKIYAPQPHYPINARKRGVQGHVIVQVIIDEEGRVSDTRVLKGHPGLTEAAVNAVKEWRFKPATLHGKPIPVYHNLTINFRLTRSRR